MEEMKEIKRLIFSILCLSFPAFVFEQTPQTIQDGFTVERELCGADKRNYEVNLMKGQMLNFFVGQRGVDVVLRVSHGGSGAAAASRHYLLPDDRDVIQPKIK